MKTIQKLIFGLVAVFAFASCNNDKTLTTSIPKDAMSVVYFNTKSLAQKSEFDIFNNPKVKQNLESAPINDKQKALLAAIQKDLNATGLNLKGNVYFFYLLDYYGVVGEVNDRTKFENNLKQILGENTAFGELSKGVSTYNIPFVGSIAWDNNKIVMLGQNYRGNVNLDDKLKELFAQTKDNSIVSLQTFQDFEKNKKDMSMYMGYSKSIYETLFNQIGISLNAQQDDALQALSGVRSISNISFDMGEIKIDASNVFDDKESKDKYLSLIDNINKPMDAKILEYIPSNTILTFGMGLDGANIFNKLNELNILTAENVGDEQIYLNIKEALSNLENFAFSLNSIKCTTNNDYGYESTNYVPQVTVVATQKNGVDVIGLLKEKISAKVEEINSYGYTLVSIETVSPKAFTLTKDQFKITFGVADNNVVYISNDEDCLKNIADGKKYNHDIKLPSSFNSLMFGNLQQLSSIPTNGLPSQVQMLQKLNIFENYEVVAPNLEGGTGSLKMKDKNKNSLAAIFDLVNTMINENM